MRAHRTLVSLLLSAPYAACGGSETIEIGPTASAEKAAIHRIVVATGTIEPEMEVEVRSRVSGIVEQVHVEAGDEVEADQPLVEIERELLEAGVTEAQARLVGSVAELTRARAELRRVKTLRRDGTVPERDEEEARALHDAAEAAVARDEAVLASLQIQRGYTTIVAPMRGRILDVDVEVGAAVASVASVAGGTRVLTIADDSQLHLEGLVDENEIAWVEVGQKALIRTEAYPGQALDGRVRKIKSLGERRQNVTYFEVEVEVLAVGEARLRTRMSADADIVTMVVEDALLVPETALLYDGDRIYVEKVVSSSAARIEPQTVRVGIVEKGRAQILEGLVAGEQVRLK
jgi:HlyD family secretion protein